MAIQVTVRKSFSALRGQAVRVHLDSSETINKLPLITAGQTAGVVSSGFQGTVQSVDYEGNSFLVIPRMPDGNMSSSSTPGILNNGELINID